MVPVFITVTSVCHLSRLCVDVLSSDQRPGRTARLNWQYVSFFSFGLFGFIGFVCVCVRVCVCVCVFIIQFLPLYGLGLSHRLKLVIFWALLW